MQEPQSHRLAALFTVLRHRRLARAMRGYTAFNIAEYGCWLAIMLWAYSLGGVGEAGRAAFVLLVPAALVAPLFGAASDRLPLDRVLTAGFALTGLTAIATGLLIANDAPTWIIYVAAASFSMMLTFGPPAIAAVIPTVAESADELTAGNVAASFLENSGRLVGPAAAGLVLLVGSPETVLLVLGVLAVVGALATIGSVDEPVNRIVHDDDPLSDGLLADLSGGLRLLRSDPQVRSLTTIALTSKVVAGSLDVAAAAVATMLLRRDPTTASLLVAMFGVGAAAGAVGGVALVGRHRIGRVVAIAVLVMSAGYVVLGVGTNTAVSAVALVVAGACMATTWVGARTMLQGLTPDDTLARVFSVLESLEAVALLTGGVVVAVIASTVGITEACIAIALICTVLLIASARQLRAVDAGRRAIDPEALALARSTAVFGPLPAYAMEQVLHSFREATYEPGERLMSRGEVGDSMMLIAHGSVIVRTERERVLERHAGEIIGEIGVIQQIPRTADVDVGPDGVQVFWMDSDAFVRAVNRSPRSHARMRAEIDRRLNN